MSLDKKIHIRLWLSVAMITIMVLLSELLHEKEIIFPEIAALAIGAWLAPKQPWETNRKKILLFMSLSASIGYSLSAYLNIPIDCKIVIGILLCMTLLFLSKTTMLPLISACILPILTEVKNIIYPISVIILTTIIVLVQLLFEKKKLKDTYTYTPLIYDIQTEVKRWLLIIITVAIMAFFAVRLDMRLIIAPPLIVAFCELTYTESKARNVPIPILIITAIAAFSGAYARILFCEVLHCPLVLPTFLVSVLTLYLMTILKLYFPPVGAIAILPMIIPKETLYLYPVQVMLGSIIFVTLAMLSGKFLKGSSA